MGRAYFLVVGDKTTCGGSIVSGCTNHTIHGQSTACEGDQYICGSDKQLHQIVGGQPDYFIHGRRATGTAHSVGTCSCRCRFINSHFDVTYGYESKIVSAPKPVTRIAPVAPQNAPKPLTMAPGPSCPVEADEPSREPVDAGFCVLPYGATPSSYESWFFINPPDGARELYHKLNPDMKKQPGSILIVVDPEKQDQQQIETLQKARDRIDNALAPLTLPEARLLHENKTAVDIFSSQLYSNALGTSGDILGYIKDSGGEYYKEINDTLKEIQELYQRTYSNNSGVISGQEFFGQRARLFKKLDGVLNRFSKSQLNLKQYENIKKALGLSTSSIMHRWDQTGVKDIEGYASYIEKSAKLIKIMKTTGYVGIGLDFASYTTNVYEACAKGRESECRKAAIVEYSKFGAKQTASVFGGTAGGIIGRSTCMWVLGMLTSEAGGAGSGLCLVTAIGSGIVGSKIAEKMGENAGESLGKVIYNKLENSDEFIHDPDTFNEEAGRLIYEKVFDGKL
ncbi:PAAR domain-containing protein [Salmonella enterica]|nr:PAAR domain-containing protein [Salmonella enterica]